MSETPPARGELRPADGYETLASVLVEAHDQAAYGKGKERHANSRPFLDQPIMVIGQMVGPGYHTGQAMKKAQEAMGMIARGEADRTRAELLGAIVYLAAAVILMDERQQIQKSSIDHSSAFL